MLRDEENHVALFIDWDNLAISTAADFGGASPDVRAIVRVAQRFGTVLLARAYAEWQVPSDRLAVYRAGVDPIFAPTFRFEPDPVNAPPRGKSLADPCLVADCIDILHLMPNLTHFVLVSGDKDLIPIVRLAQLRGRRVVVLGPDYVATILREMADDYISYRSIVEAGDAVATPGETTTYGSRGRRRSIQAPAPRPSAVVAAAAPAQVTAPPQVSPPAQVTAPAQVQPSVPTRTAPVPQSSRPIPAPPPSRPAAIEPVVPPSRPATVEPPRPVVVEVPRFAEPAGPAEDLESSEAPVQAEASAEETRALYATIEQILHEREAQGKPRLRATNLKDLLMNRIPGFGERRFGFARFRDLLSAAERAGVLELNRTGPVHWVALPRRRPEPATAEVPAAVEAAPEVSLAEPEAPVASGIDLERDIELVRFVVDLRNRSRWLTYTYVLTNLISHLSQRMPAAAAETEAPSALRRLVQEGILRVDREPREIEVGGSRHRVKMCHLEESHPVVQAVLAGVSAGGPGSSTLATEETAASPEAATPAESPAPPAEQAPAAVAPSHSVAEPAPAVIAAAPGARRGLGLPPLPDSLLLPTALAATAAGSAPVSAPPVTAVVESAAIEASAPAEPSAPVVSEAERPTLVGGTTSEQPASPVATTRPAAAEAFAALREVVRQATGPGKSQAGAASVKTRLARMLGTFDEREYGFGKFKDFLLAAQREGFVRVESIGPATRVSLPDQG